jgi:hypothetical protein
LIGLKEEGEKGIERGSLRVVFRLGTFDLWFEN